MTKIGRPIEETPLAGRVRSWGDPSCAAHRLWTLAVHKMSPSFSVAYSAWSASDQKSAIGRPRMAFSPASGWMRRAHIRLGCMRRVEALWGQITPSDRHPALLADNSTCGLSLTGRNGSCSGLGAGVVFGKNLKIPTTSALVFASDVGSLSDLHPYGTGGHRHLWETGEGVARTALSPVCGVAGRSHRSTSGRSRITISTFLGLARGAIARYSVFRLGTR